MTVNLLLVEDDLSLQNSLNQRLVKEGYNVLSAESVSQALDVYTRYNNLIDLAIIDINLPDGDGFSLANKLNKEKKQLPFIFLTAMNSAEFRLEGFEIGAEDYITKPFHIKELLLRLEKIVKKLDINTIIKTETLTLNPQGFILTTKEGANHTMSQSDFALLAHLIKSSPRAITRQELANIVWGDQDKINLRTIDNAIVRIRNILPQQDKSKLHSVRGIGYQWLE